MFASFQAAHGSDYLCYFHSLLQSRLLEDGWLLQLTHNQYPVLLSAQCLPKEQLFVAADRIIRGSTRQSSQGLNSPPPFVSNTFFFIFCKNLCPFWFTWTNSFPKPWFVFFFFSLIFGYCFLTYMLSAATSGKDKVVHQQKPPKVSFRFSSIKWS